MTITIIRHAQSLANVHGESAGRNPELTAHGHHQSSQLQGQYDLVIISPLRRTHQTLASSKIQFDKLIILDECREIRQLNLGDYLDDEIFVDESITNLSHRSNLFLQKLREYQKQYHNILVISHYCFIKHNFNQQLMNCEHMTINHI